MQKWTDSGAASRRPPSPHSPPPSAATGRPMGRRQRPGFDETNSSSASGLQQPSESRPRLTTWDDDDDAAGIPMIPDLDEVIEEDLALQVAPAPSAPVNRVATMQELNDELQKKPGFMTLDGVDLQLLSRSVQERHEVEEPDKPWQWDVLFTELLSETQDDPCPELLISPDPTPQLSTGTLKKSTGAGSLRRASRSQTRPAASVTAATSRV